MRLPRADKIHLAALLEFNMLDATARYLLTGNALTHDRRWMFYRTVQADLQIPHSPPHAPSLRSRQDCIKELESEGWSDKEIDDYLYEHYSFRKMYEAHDKICNEYEFGNGGIIHETACIHHSTVTRTETRTVWKRRACEKSNRQYS